MEVSALSREVMSPKLNLYPLDYRAAFASSIIPYSQSRGLALRLAFPRFGLPQGEGGSPREDYGLTTFRMNDTLDTDVTREFRVAPNGFVEETCRFSVGLCKPVLSDIL